MLLLLPPAVNTASKVSALVTVPPPASEPTSLANPFTSKVPSTMNAETELNAVSEKARKVAPAHNRRAAQISVVPAQANYPGVDRVPNRQTSTTCYVPRKKAAARCGYRQGARH